MKFLYKINSAYDGFTPQKIEERLHNGIYIIYNWREYFDNVEKGDVVFTYFVGRGVRKGVYLIAKVSEIKRDKRVIGKVLRYDMNEPLIPLHEFEKCKDKILTRPIGSVYVIPSSLDIVFEDLKKKVAISEIDIKERADCYTCYRNKKFNCKSCTLLNPNYLIKWDEEVSSGIRKMSNIKEISSAFWVIPRQAHWMRKTITQHPISEMFYDFKSGYYYYSNLFGFGILKAIEYHPRFKVNFNYILGIPLSPDKKKNGEFDRVAKLCEIVSKELKVSYLNNGLELTKPISRRSYKLNGLGNQDFSRDYYGYVDLNTPNLNNKTILIIDDVITDGITLKTTAKKILDKFPSVHIYAATAGIMAKKGNMTRYARQKFSK